MTPETPAKVTATTLPDEPDFDEAWYHAPGEMKKYIDALLQSFNAERLRAEAAEAEVARLTERLDDARRAHINDALHTGKSMTAEHERMLQTLDAFKAAEARAEAMAKAHAWLLANYDTCGLEYYNGQYEYYSAKLPGRHFATMKELVDTAIEQGAQHG